MLTWTEVHNSNYSGSSDVISLVFSENMKKEKEFLLLKFFIGGNEDWGKGEVDIFYNPIQKMVMKCENQDVTMYFQGYRCKDFPL